METRRTSRNGKRQWSDDEWGRESRRWEIHLRGESTVFSTVADEAYIARVQLFDTASVVEYYESFAKHAFESTSTSVTLQCVVLGPDGRPVPCAFCFSVRRDLFSVSLPLSGSTRVAQAYPDSIDAVSFLDHRILLAYIGLKRSR